MEARTTIKDTKEAENDTEKKTSAESSIFSTILADIERNPTILQNQRNLSAEVSIFTTILADIDDENPTILQNQRNLIPQVSVFTTFLGDSDEENPTTLQKKKKKELKKTKRRGSTPIDFSCTIPKTLRRSYLVDSLNQELKILKSELKSKGQTSGLSRNPNYGRECGGCVEEGKVEEQREKVKFLAEGDGAIDEAIEEMLGMIEKDGSYLEQIKYNYENGDFHDDRFREELRKKADKDEKEISSWISNGEPEAETRVSQEEKQDIKKKSPVKVNMEKTDEQESTVTKRDYSWCKRRWYLIEKLRQREENLKKRRAKAVRFGVEFSFLVAEVMFLIPTEFLASEIEDFWISLKRFGVNGDDGKGTSVIIGKLEEVFEVVIKKKENKERHNVNVLESVFRFDGYKPLCVDAIQFLGKIVWGLRRSKQSERVELCDLDSLFEDCQRVLMKLELKLAEMKQRMYRSVSADYESVSKTERFGLLSRKVMRRANADNRFGRSVIGCYLTEIWKSLFQAEALQEQRKEE
ncbi:unnamed protein product [Microthlaspi erraticum]|uniref:Uncharacterized protein n=1 Tax=Microthlaspi erraticum TaxID=1685480 RepID=A0A6D2JSU7_9BRAS|nr:unnamed protein product [Microthlaspi erraticum]